MQGLELSESFYRASVDELFDGMADVRARHAAGLAGEGSECFGFDDEISHDHDWGPGFCIWLGEDDFAQAASELQERYVRIASRGFKGFPARIDSTPATAPRRTGILSIKGFYAQLLGARFLPATLDEWRAIPESSLAAAVNGCVFEDELGRFSEIRTQLTSYYPEDIRLRIIASECMHAAQAGQYNFIRQSERSELVAAFQALSEFCDAAIHIAYALARRYRPFYKWAHRGLRDLGAFGICMADRLDALLTSYRSEEPNAVAMLVESICTDIADELSAHGLSESDDTFLVSHGIAVNAHIADDAYRRSDLMRI